MINDSTLMKMYYGEGSFSGLPSGKEYERLSKIMANYDMQMRESLALYPDILELYCKTVDSFDAAYNECVQNTYRETLRFGIKLGFEVAKDNDNEE